MLIIYFHCRNPDEKMLKFPCTKNILWDHDSIGSDAQISISYYRYCWICLYEIQVAGKKIIFLQSPNVDGKSDVIHVKYSMFGNCLTNIKLNSGHMETWLSFIN